MCHSCFRGYLAHFKHRQLFFTDSHESIWALHLMEMKQSSEIYLNHEREIKQLFFKYTRCQSATDDLAHELLLKLQAISNLTDIDNIRAYLFRMAANLVSERMRTETRQNRLLEKHAEALLSVQGSFSPEDSLMAREQLETLETAIAELPLKCRQVFLLRKIDHLSHEEIAERLAISRSMVEKHLCRAMMHCRDRLYQPKPS